MEKPQGAAQESWVALLLSGLSTATLAKLLRTLGTADAVLSASRAQLLSLLPEKAIRRLRTPEPTQLKQALDWLVEDGHQLITWEDPDYPKGVLELSDAPPALFYLGERSALRRAALAVVGSRNASPQGMDNARAFARTLSEAGMVVISGLARGIDTAAHEGALAGKGGSTIAVIGTGPDRVYPAQNRELARRIVAEGGGILSEFIPGTPPTKENFPRRNRLISGIAQGVLVVEATLSSGSLITARFAGEQGREVFAIPGSIHSPFSKGCHKLIREGAKLVETAQDILDELPGERARATSAPRQKTPVATAPAEDPDGILAALGFDPVDLDTLIARTGLSVEQLLGKLAELELEGKVRSLAGGVWEAGDR